MSKSTKTLYVSEKTWSSYQDLYGSKSTGASNALDSWLGARRAALSLLKGKFTKPELMGLIDSLNGTAWPEKSMQARPEMLAAQMEDAHDLDGVSRRWQYEGPALLEKINNMHPLECFFLIEEITAFWERSSDTDSSLEEFANTLL